ncbi:MAG: peptidylprolyl isomerase [Bacteroidales bacterium]|nr:peptidylprolyl isomerase [Bacteroidales bacterium]MCF8404556.1 peptidylprolyl isomerase [Bacteroidales bacterium]
MNNLRILIFGIIILLGTSLNAQDTRTLVTIAGEKISVDDFMYVYQKNNNQGEVMDKKSVEEYLDLYINFKLKVKEAEAQGYDTVKAFQDELAGYRKQLAEPYFANEEIIDELLQEAYDRKQFDIRASHILIKVGPNAMPEDTLKAYNKLMAARERILKGEPFKKVAMEVSEDPSARPRTSQRGGKDIPGNGGDLGYFSVFDMVYPFENGAYNTKVGEVSAPIRTDFGYHLIYVQDKIPAQGSIEAAHLYIQMPDSATTSDSATVKDKIFGIYDQIVNGENFDDLVKEYSDDKGSASKGGLLPKFNVNRMVPEFIEVIATMQDSGNFSKPVLTSYGWHIVKLISKSGLEPFDEVKDEMRKRIEKDKRAQKSKEIIIRDIKKEYGYKEYPKALDGIYAIIDSTIYDKKWQVPENAKLSKAIFKLGDKEFTQIQFAEYIASKNNIGKDEKINEYVNKVLKEYVDQECQAYEDSKLEGKYPEFKAIVKEYRDGILLFELTNDKIWSFASKDTTGLKVFYDKHKTDFMWENRLDATIYTLLDSAYLEKARELVATGIQDDKLTSQMNNDSITVIKFERKKFQKGENNLIDGIKWKKGISENKKERGKYMFAYVHSKVAPEPKSFDEARGLITAGYQEELEKNWIAELRQKYPFEINKEVLGSIIK